MVSYNWHYVYVVYNVPTNETIFTEQCDLMKYYFLFQTAEESNIDPVKRLKKKRSGTSIIKGKIKSRTFSID